MPDPAIVQIEPHPEMTVVRIVPVSLDDEAQLQSLQVQVRSAADDTPGRPVALDFSRVSFLASLALTIFIRMHSEFRGRQQRLMLAGLQPDIRDVFVVTRLDRVFELHDDLAAAERAVRPA